MIQFNQSFVRIALAGQALGYGVQSTTLPGLTAILQPTVRQISHLAYEEVTAGKPTANHPTASPSRTLILLHGLLGCARNWRTWSRRLVEGAAARYPAEGGPWRAVLVDLRCHGGSARRPGLHPPHNMRAAAEDVSALIRHKIGSHAPGAVVGHSMGGKVALALLEHCAAPAGAAVQPSGTAAAVPAAAAAAGGWCSPPRQLWVLDSQPGRVPTELDAGTGVSRVLNTVQSIPLPVPNRAWLLSHLRERGFSEALATWLASNLVPVPHTQQLHQPHSHSHPPSPPAGQLAAAPSSRDHLGHHNHHHNHHHHGQPQHHHQQHHQQHHQHGGGDGTRVGPLTWSFDIQGAAAMYMSYRTTEYWHVLESPPNGTAVYLVQGDRSDRWPSDMERRLAAALQAAASQGGPAGPGESGDGSMGGPGGQGGGSFKRLVLEKAGHWLHVDNPEGLLRLVLPRLEGL